MPELGITFTSDELINEMKVRQTVPTSQGTFQDADFVRLLNAAMLQKVLPAIHRVKEEYFIKYTDSAIVANQANYAIPVRAVGGQLRDVVYLDPDGTESELPRLQPEDLKRPIPTYGVILRSNEIIMSPTPLNATGSIRFYYERRPNNLCVVTSAGKISSIDTVLHQVVVVTKPSTWAVGTKIDFTSGDPIFQSRGDGYAITGISGFTISFASLPTGLAVGDFAAESGFSPIPQLPYEGHLVMAQYAAAWSMRSLSNKRPAEDAEKAADNMLLDFVTLINPRIDGETKRFANTGNGIFGAGYSGWRLNVGP